MVQFDLGMVGNGGVDDMIYFQLKIPWEEFCETYVAELRDISSNARELIHTAAKTQQVYHTRSLQNELVRFFEAIKQRKTFKNREEWEEFRSKNAQNIKRIILELGTKFTRLQVAEIAESCNVSEESVIIATIQDMIAKHQVDARYFTSTKAVAFDQQANLASRDAFIAELEAEFARWGKDAQKGTKKS